MRDVIVSIALLATLYLASCTDRTLSAAGSAVGLVRLSMTDPDRQDWQGSGERPLVTTMWYPATDGAAMTKIVIPPEQPVFIGGFAARNAGLSDAHETYPLILMSHGTGGAGMQMMWLARALAEEGYIVAAVDHHGNTAAEAAFDPRGFRMPWERARDITAVLDQLLTDPEWGPRIESSQIGAAGFSLGGYTVTALAGGQIDFDQFEAFCSGADRDATCADQGEFPEAGKQFTAMLERDPELRSRMAEHKASYRDERIHAVVALAPALGQAFTRDSLSTIAIPFLLIIGSADDVAPPTTNAQYISREVPNARLLLIPDAGHYVFLNRCNRRGKRFVPVCRDDSATVRDHAHEVARAEAIEFFDTTFGR